MIKVLSILGSPHKKGNTAHLLAATLEGAELAGAYVKQIAVNDLQFRGCIDCKSCYQTGQCILKDDFSHIYAELDQADIIIVASPIYFLSLPAKLKAAIDRTQAFWASKYILKQPSLERNKKRYGIFLATGGASPQQRENLPARAVIKMFFQAVNTKYYRDLLVFETDATPVTSNPELLLEAQNLGRQVVTNYENDLLLAKTTS